MRPITVTLLSTCAVCALAQGHHSALAQPAPGTASPTKPTDPPLPTNTDPTSPMNPQLPPSGPNNPSPPTSADPTSTDPTSSPGPTSPALPPSPDSSTTPADVPPAPAPVPSATTDAVDSSADGTDIYSYAWTDDQLKSGIGVSAILGGGVTGFTDKTMRDTTSSVGGLWDLRVTIGSHIPLALDVSYLGSAMNINGLPSGRNGTLVGTTAEAALRFNILPHYAWNPYIFGGVGWQRYDVTQTNVTLSDSGMNDKDNLLEFPMGAGIAFRKAGFVGDLRGTFRAAMDQNLVLKNPSSAPISPTSSDFAAMHTWEASAAVGYEF
jgi:hypothetical protein